MACSWNCSSDWEFEAIFSEEVRSGSSDIVFLMKYCCSNNRNGVSGSSVITSHIHMKLTDSTIERNVSVLFIHVVDTSSGLISENYSEGFNMVRSPLVDLIDREDLTLG